MTKYFYHDGVDQKGPFAIEELNTENIKPETPIWFEGLAQWSIASEITQLEHLFKIASPPPFNPSNKVSITETPPLFKPDEQIEKPIEPTSPRETSNVFAPTAPKSNTGLIWIISLIAGAVLIVIIAALINNSNHSSSIINTESYQEKVMTVEEIERANPAQFLDASGTYKETFFGDKVRVHGTITNNATVAGYKDVVVEIIFYSATETELDRKQYTIYDFFPAHQTKSFELKIVKPQACEKLGWNAVNATPN